MSTESSSQSHAQNPEQNIADHPDFEALMQELLDAQAMLLVPTANSPAEAWTFIEMNNLFDRLMPN